MDNKVKMDNKDELDKAMAVIHGMPCSSILTT